MPQIHRAAYNLDLKTVISLLSATPLAPTPNTHTVAHALLHGMHSIKAGDISRTLGWTDVRRTLLRHEYVLALEPEVRPVLAEVLRREPRQATHVDAGGHSPLHVAALVGAVGFIDELLLAGASPAQRNAGGRTPVDEAALSGTPRRRCSSRRARPSARRTCRAFSGPRCPARPSTRARPRRARHGGGSGGDGRRPVDEGERPRNGAAGAAPTRRGRRLPPTAAASTSARASRPTSS